MPPFPVNRRFFTAATCWISRITNSEEGVVQCAPMVNVPHSPLLMISNQKPNSVSKLRYHSLHVTPSNFLRDLTKMKIINYTT